jgi:hypothetical protein
VTLGVLCVPLVSAGQQAPPAGVVPPDQNLPPHIRKLAGFGGRADFSLDNKRVLFLSKTFGDAMEIDLATGVIRIVTAHFPHFGFTRALYLSNGHNLLSGPTEFNPGDVGAARTNCWLFVLDPAGNARPQPLGVKAAEGPVPSRKRMHIAWSYRAAQFPGGDMPAGSSQIHEADITYEQKVPKLANLRKILDSRDLPFKATLEPQNYRPPLERELIFSAYDYPLAISSLIVACRTISYFGQVTNRSSRRPYANLPIEPPGGGRTWWAHVRSTPVNIGPTIPSEKIEDLLEILESVTFSGGY